jgi:hypothetical protein
VGRRAGEAGRRDGAALAVDTRGSLESRIVVGSVEQPELLAAMGGIEGVVDVESDAAWHLVEAGAVSPTMAWPIRSRSRARGRFSSREMVGCEHSAAPSGSRPRASLKAGSCRRLSASLPSS